jgi:hypothetical protein
LLKKVIPDKDPQRDDEISETCPGVNNTDQSRSGEPQVLFGEGFDVGAIGFGLGPTMRGEGAILMWGSSFAAPRVTALALQIISKTRARGIRLDLVPAAEVADRIRFTTDKLSGVARYGVINAFRALGFERDIVKLVDSVQESEDRRWATSCENANGFLEINRDLEQKTHLHKSGGKSQSKSPETISLHDIFRLRRVSDTDDLFEVMLRSGIDPVGTPPRKLNLSGEFIPLRCVDGKIPHKDNLMPASYIKDVTRCSFSSKCE